MIHRLFSLCSVIVVAFGLAVPMSAQAASSNTKQIQNLFNQLKALPNIGGPNAKVIQLVNKLAKLDPVKATKYYKTGLTKIAPLGAEATALSLAKSVVNILKKSGIPAGKINSVTKQVNKAANAYVPPPTPYQAMLWHAGAICA